ncbi:enoyl-CoA hydratase/isomerase family protein [Glaciimonas soli]|uniref:Enoyl-CoA hydratase/isomerase family protein n=1 Tax=Glaciimonas soli TaxID=2590999 RepID=A0A843Z1K2_9BURK|nr:enoyl-CoA hydratase/isomerase family protein [Glaciimonas soli]MQR02736.1 enoyl-CoA hydratase/isomerase family protein [Glaciimonas soli]
MIIENIGQVRHLTLNRPARRNALDSKSIEELAHALQDADRDPTVRAIVLSGAAPAFCSGSDLKELSTMSIQEMCDSELETAQVARSLAGLSKPVIAAVEGFALGGGFVLAISCDIVVTTSNARWHLPEVPNGWLPPWGLQALLARVGPVRARMLTWAADAIDGNEAYRLGVADYLTKPECANQEALSLAQRLAALPPEAITSTKRFFEPFVTHDGERLDRLATQHFASNCEGGTAQALLSKFKVKS